MTIIAAVQMTSTDDVEANLKTAAHAIAQAAQQGAQLVVLPEMFALIGVDMLGKVKISEPFGEGHIQTFLATQARTHKLWIVAGTIPIKSGTPNKIRGACLVFNPQGEVVARYDKMHLFDVCITQGQEEYRESSTTEPGQHISVIATPFGKLGIAVCYDIRFPELFRCLFNAGAEIIVIPAAFTMTTGKAHWELLARARAVENFCYVVGACQVGTHPGGRQTYGHSLIVNPWGDVIAQLGNEPGIIQADIELSPLHEIRQRIPIGQHQRIPIEMPALNEST